MKCNYNIYRDDTFKTFTEMVHLKHLDCAFYIYIVFPLPLLFSFIYCNYLYIIFCNCIPLYFQTIASSLAEGLGINVELVKGGRTKKLMLSPTVTEPHLLVATMGALSKLTTAGKGE